MNRFPGSLRSPLILAFWLLLFTLTGIVRGEQPATLDPSTVVYPRTHADAESAPAPITTDRSASPMLIGLGVVLVAVGGWYWWKYRVGPAGRSRSVQNLAIEETRPLGNRQFLLVVSHEKRRFLLGVCPGHMEMLTELDSKAPESPAP